MDDPIPAKDCNPPTTSGVSAAKKTDYKCVVEKRTVNKTTRLWIYIEDIQVDREIILLIYDDKKKSINKDFYKQYKNRIARNHVDPIVGCIALIKSYHIGIKKIYTGSEELCFWMYCQHPPCERRFKAACSLGSVAKGVFKLYRSNHEQTHINLLTRHIRGQDRVDCTKDLAKCMPMDYRRQKIEEANDELLSEKNLQGVASDAVYNKIRFVQNIVLQLLTSMRHFDCEKQRRLIESMGVLPIGTCDTNSGETCNLLQTILNFSKH